MCNINWNLSTSRKRTATSIGVYRASKFLTAFWTFNRMINNIIYPLSRIIFMMP